MTKTFLLALVSVKNDERKCDFEIKTDQMYKIKKGQFLKVYEFFRTIFIFTLCLMWIRPCHRRLFFFACILLLLFYFIL